jgi:hypothetical protein
MPEVKHVDLSIEHRKQNPVGAAIAYAVEQLANRLLK